MKEPKSRAVLRQVFPSAQHADLFSSMRCRRILSDFVGFPLSPLLCSSFSTVLFYLCVARPLPPCSLVIALLYLIALLFLFHFSMLFPLPPCSLVIASLFLIVLLFLCALLPLFLYVFTLLFLLHFALLSFLCSSSPTLLFYLYFSLPIPLCSALLFLLPANSASLHPFNSERKTLFPNF